MDCVQHHMPSSACFLLWPRWRPNTYLYDSGLKDCHTNMVILAAQSAQLWYPQRHAVPFHKGAVVAGPVDKALNISCSMIALREELLLKFCSTSLRDILAAQSLQLNCSSK